ncbi:hypothetical protein QE152_g29587 [Popillia japonica]|uniref:Uncharacterized protein n=1 Tax=Popillia japonica TaxID=7064 RepID=A0AAW1JGM2_POPJA
MSHIKDILPQSQLMNTLDVYTQENKKRQDLLSDMTLENVDMATIWFPEEKTETEDLRQDLLSDMTLENVDMATIWYPEEKTETEDLLPSTSSQNKVTEWLKQREEASEDDVDFEMNDLR